jgi:hypothetical protein
LSEQQENDFSPHCLPLAFHRLLEFAAAFRQSALPVLFVLRWSCLFAQVLVSLDL